MLASSQGGCATTTTDSYVGDEDASTPRDAGNEAGRDAGYAPWDSSTGNDDSATGDDSAADLDVNTGDGGPQSDAICDAIATKAGCEQCCISNHKTGYGTYTTALTQCACTSPGACQTQCATEYCVGKPTSPGDACTNCLTASLMSMTGSCYNPLNAACQGDPDCVDLFGTCIPPCTGKP